MGAMSNDITPEPTPVEQVSNAERSLEVFKTAFYTHARITVIAR